MINTYIVTVSVREIVSRRFRFEKPYPQIYTTHTLGLETYKPTNDHMTKVLIQCFVII